MARRDDGTPKSPEDAGPTRDWEALATTALRLARVWTRCADEAHDVAQEALLRLLKDFRVRQPVPWLYVTTRNLARRYRRLANRYSMLELDQLCSHVGDPTIARSFLRRLICTDRNLSARQRRILLLVVIGHTHVEIAERIGCARRDVGQHATRAVRRLQKSARVGVSKTPHWDSS